jgi:hypothetical protein
MQKLLFWKWHWTRRKVFVLCKYNAPCLVCVVISERASFHVWTFKTTTSSSDDCISALRRIFSERTASYHLTVDGHKRQMFVYTYICIWMFLKHDTKADYFYDTTANFLRDNFLLVVVYKCVFKRDKFSVGVHAILKVTYFCAFILFCNFQPNVIFFCECVVKITYNLLLTLFVTTHLFYSHFHQKYSQFTFHKSLEIPAEF